MGIGMRPKASPTAGQGQGSVPEPRRSEPGGSRNLPHRGTPVLVRARAAATAGGTEGARAPRLPGDRTGGTPLHSRVRSAASGRS